MRTSSFLRWSGLLSVALLLTGLLAPASHAQQLLIDENGAALGSVERSGALCTSLPDTNCPRDNLGNVVSDDLDASGFVGFVANAVDLGQHTVCVEPESTISGNVRVGFRLNRGGGLLDVTLLSRITLSTRFGGTTQQSRSGGDLLLLQLLFSSTSNKVVADFTDDFDELCFSVSSTLGLAETYNLFFSFVDAQASPARSVLFAQAGNLPSDGTSTTTVTLLVTDADGDPLIGGGDAVVFSTTAGTLGPVTDNGDGTYSAELTASGNNETALITATLNGDPVDDSATVNFFTTADFGWIDDWRVGQRTQTTPSGDDTVANSVQGSSILGAWRNVWLLADGVIDGQTSFRSDTNERTAAFGNEAGATGTTRIVWDGSRKYVDPDGQGGGDFGAPDPIGAYLDGNNNLDPFLNPLVNDPALAVNPTGLGGVDLTGSCTQGDYGFHILFDPTDQGEIDISIEVFSDGQNWSRLTRDQDDGVPRIISFPFADFVAQGGSGGADFSDVGAVVLTLDVDSPAVDVLFDTPVLLGCGVDFGDAPVTRISGSPVSYRTIARSLGRVALVANPDVAGGFLIDGTNLDDPETRSFRGPHHALGGPFLGLGANDTDPEADGQPSLSANGDDNDGNNDERGVFISNRGLVDQAIDPNGDVQVCAGVSMGVDGRQNWYCAEVLVSNPTSQWAQVAGWIDVRGNGAFDNRCGGGVLAGDGPVINDGRVVYESNVRACERSSFQVILGDLSQAGHTGVTLPTEPTGFRSAAGASCPQEFLDLEIGDVVLESASGSGFELGNVPPGCEGVLVLTWNFAEVEDQITLNQTYSRFRISTDRFLSGQTGCGFFQATGPTPFCFASDGEVEDHVIPEDTLPVSIHAFESNWTRAGLEVTFGTVSETENIGFYIWGYDGDDLFLLTPEMIPSQAYDAVHPQQYRVLITDPKARQADFLAVTAVDTHFEEEMYGFFAVNQQFGRETASSPIAWESIGEWVEERLALRQATASASLVGARSSQGAVAVDFRVEEAGLQQVSYEMLKAAGLDLTGVAPQQIAVTRAGEPVARFVTPARSSAVGARPGFGPGGVVEFWGELPSYPDALYVSHYQYRITVDPERAVAARQLDQRPTGTSPDHYLARVHINQDNGYHFGNPLPDPWFAARLRSNNSNLRQHITQVPVSQAFIPSGPARLEVQVAGGTAPPVSPAHHVRVYFNGVSVAESKFEGLSPDRLIGEVPAHLIQPGNNEVRVFLPGGTEAPVDIVFLDTITLYYPRATQLGEGQRVLIESHNSEGALRVAGLGARSRGMVYAWDGADLFRLAAYPLGTNQFQFQTLQDRANVQYFAASQQGAIQPTAVGSVGANDLLDEAADLLVIAHPAFLPVSARELHPLNRFVQQRQSEGWSVRLINIEDIQAHYGGGMPLPQALPRFLQEADQAFAYSHVLLVGGDSYDYHDHLGLGSISFIPTFYTATSRIPHTPADALLADLTGDGVSDKALGRWPVRSLGDLEAIVTKTLDWSGNANALAGAVWVADSDDPNQASFRSQAERMIDGLVEAGWPEDELHRVFIDDIGDVTAARHALFDLLEQGQAFTGFVGHGAPAMWTFQGLVAPNDLADLDNRGRPTLVSTSTCYTSYFVSPFSETVAHRWMNGFMLDGAGNQVAGAANGAVAIHGAATLSNYAQNEFVVQRVKQALMDGATLGEAVLQARQAAAERRMNDQVRNWTLLGDPTLTAGSR
ncbi:MAG: C25 family cysteine peptidase [Wenzhouxiangella sp.]